MRVELYRRLGYFPTESSEHSAEYLPWLMRDDAALERFRIPVDEYVRRSEDNLAEYDAMRAALREGQRIRASSAALEYAPLIIHSIVTGHRRVIYGNVTNHGLIDNLPDGRVRRGAVPGRPRPACSPTHVGALPPQLRRAEPDVPQRGRAHRRAPR